MENFPGGQRKQVAICGLRWYSPKAQRVGAVVGTNVGVRLGTGVGAGVGNGVGEALGAGVGTGVGADVGPGVGSAVGDGVGTAVGACVGGTKVLACLIWSLPTETPALIKPVANMATKASFRMAVAMEATFA